MSKTERLLMEKYERNLLVPVEVACRDFFHLKPDKFLRKVALGQIKIPVVRMYDDSQKAAKAIRVDDLARYLDNRYDKAVKEYNALYE